MAWIQIIPRNRGGGRTRSDPAARLYKSGQLVFNHAAAELLGTPPRVRLEVSTTTPEIRLRPTTGDDAGGFSFNGGGNSSYRIMCRTLVKNYPHLVGALVVSKAAHGLMLTAADE